MAYGQNLPFGMSAISNLDGSTWNGQTRPYLIASGYARNIFKGDLVILTNTGYIQSLWDYAAPTGPTGGAGNGAGGGTFGIGSSIGVFMGCSYTSPTGVNPIDPASPGKLYWPGGTVPLNAVPAIAAICDDPNVIYQIQTGGAGAPGALGAALTAVGRTASVVFQTGGGNVSGNTQNGQSYMALDLNTLNSGGTTQGAPFGANLNLKIIAIDADLRNQFVPGIGLNAVPYNTVDVLIQNHSYLSRPAPYA